MFNKLGKILTIATLGVIFISPFSASANQASGGDIIFDLNPKTISAGIGQAYTLKTTATIKIYNQELKNYCGANTRSVTWSIYAAIGQTINTGFGDRLIGRQTVPVDFNNPSPQSHDYAQSVTDSGFQSGISERRYYAVLECGTGGVGQKEITYSAIIPVSFTGTAGTGTCGGTGQPACPPGTTTTSKFKITNPLKGGANTVAELVAIIVQWIFTIAIPIAVGMIIYAGVLFLTAQGDSGKVTKAKDTLKWAVIGLAIIMIGSGFISLIRSILELGGANTPATNQQPQQPGGGLPVAPPSGVNPPGSVVNPPSTATLTITTTSLSDATVGQPYFGQLFVQGGTQPYRFTNTGALPPGLTLGFGGGDITGTPTTIGTYTFTVRVTDGSSPQQTATQLLTIRTAPPMGTLSIATNSLPNARVGQQYLAQIRLGGIYQSPVTFSVSGSFAAGGLMPAGIALNPDGSITGIPTTAGTYIFVIGAIDSSNPAQSVTKSLTITVN